MGWDSAIVKKVLKNLQWVSTGTGWKKVNPFTCAGKLLNNLVQIWNHGPFNSTCHTFYIEQEYI